MNYYIRKIGSFILTIILVAIITFSVFQVLPGNPALVILGVDADSVQIENLSSSMNLDKSAPVRFCLWLKNAVKGDLGQSYRYKIAVSSIVKNAFYVTFQLSLFVLFLTAIFGIPLGAWLAVHDKKKVALPVSFIAMLGVSFPVFCVALLFIIVFSVKIPLFPSMGYVPFSSNPVACLKSLFLPAISISFGSISILIRYMRTSVLSELKKDYIRTAKSKGMSSFYILIFQVLRNSLIPVLTIFGMLTAEILGGSIIVENVFSLPGIGKTLANSITSRDFPLIQGLVLYLSFIVIFCNFIVDMLYSIIDPRIRQRGDIA